jgi:hypothetical protein
MNPKLPLYLALLMLTQCSKCKSDDPAPLAQLPPATQEGKNTFGCLVNGQAFTPSGSVGLSSNFVVSYEPSATLGGNLNIQAFRYRSDNANSKQTIQLSAGPIFQARTYRLDLSSTEGLANYFDRSKPSPCDDYFYADMSYRRGSITLTRLDEQAGIIAGTFEVTMAKTGCDTIRITDGRFDYKL